MTSPRTNLIGISLSVIVATALLSACVPQPMAPQHSNLTLDMRRLQSSLDQQEQALEDLTRQVTEHEARLQEQAQEIDRLRRAPQTPGSVSRPAVMPQQQAGATASVQSDGSPTEVYLQAFGDYASGRYQLAIDGFETFLRRFPNNSYASNAQYWLGDSYFNQQQYSTAIQEFDRVLIDYPNAPKAPDALYKIAIAQLQLGATEAARQAVDTLTQRYPQSTAAQKAKELVIP